MPRTTKTPQDMLNEFVRRAQFSDAVLALAQEYGLIKRGPGRQPGYKPRKRREAAEARPARGTNGADKPQTRISRERREQVEADG